MCAACRRTPFALRLVTAIRAGAVLAARPRSVVAHLVLGRLTTSGVRVARTTVPLCRAVTRTLYVVADRTALDTLDGVRVALTGRRVCRRCQYSTPAALALDGASTHRMVTNDDFVRAYSNLTPLDLTIAARWALTVADTHTIGAAAQLLYGSKPVVGSPDNLPPVRAAIWRMHDTITRRRRALTAAERTDEQRAGNASTREARDALSERARTTAAAEAVLVRAQTRHARGQYLMPHERDLLGLPARHTQPTQETHR